MSSRLTISRWLLCCLLSMTLAQASPRTGLEAQGGQSLTRQQERELQDYFKKWLKEDVVYIISDEERSVFENLTTVEEKEKFVEQFWMRRDPDPRTAINEFREEHYRRIAYANEQFTSGRRGWKTDRGRIYIIHGPPTEIQARPTGGAYIRPMHEGGGTTGTFPFEIWRYRNIDGLGQDVELEFVDPTYSEEYRLARNPWEKDALLYTPTGGMTLAEEMGLISRAHRPAFNPNSREARDNYPLMYQFQRAKDDPFLRYETYTFAQSPPEFKNKELREIVKVKVSYSTLPFRVRSDYFKIGENRVLVPISVELQNSELTYINRTGIYEARVAIYGLVTSITNRIITEFEDEVTSEYSPIRFEDRLKKRSMYQKILPLDARGRYKLELVVKDLNSGKVGVVRQGIIPTTFPDEKLTVSSMILSDQVRRLEATPDREEMFVLGDIRVFPIIGRTFRVGQSLAVYLQVYGFGVDQTSSAPSLRVAYRVRRDGKTQAEVVDESGESVEYFSPYRVVLLRGLPIQALPAGEYQLEVEIEDRTTGRKTAVRDKFKLAAPNLAALNP